MQPQLNQLFEKNRHYTQLGMVTGLSFNIGYAAGSVANHYFGISDWIVDRLS